MLQGRKSTQDERGVAALKAVEVDDSLNGAAKQVGHISAELQLLQIGLLHGPAAHRPDRSSIIDSVKWADPRRHSEFKI